MVDSKIQTEASALASRSLLCGTRSVIVAGLCLFSVAVYVGTPHFYYSESPTSFKKMGANADNLVARFNREDLKVKVLMVGDSITAASCCCDKIKNVGYANWLHPYLQKKTRELGLGDSIYEFILEAGSGVRSMMPNDQKCATAQRHGREWVHPNLPSIHI
eukprot:SAG31_NODE_558_length_14153_cov_9.068094_14_plen_161_part_00